MKRFTPHFKKFILSLLLYPVLMAAAFALYAVMADAETPVAWQYVVVLLPVVPVFFAVRAFANGIGALDELQRRLQLEAVAFSLGGVVLCALTLGLLELAGFPRLNWGWLAPIAAALWGIGLGLAAWRYR